MITGRQIREARELLGWNARAVARKAGIHVATLIRAEAFEGSITTIQAERVRRALEAAGVEFIVENGGGPGVRLRKSAE